MKLTAPLPSLDVAALRAEFPALDQRVHGHPLVYLDNAATTQKPRAVIDVLRRYYEVGQRPSRRPSAQPARRMPQAAREDSLLERAIAAEIIYTRNATEESTWRARLCEANVRSGDEVLITRWSITQHRAVAASCERTGALLRGADRRVGN
jgi:cysteine desulfurase/selenocysteine lyase